MIDRKYLDVIEDIFIDGQDIESRNSKTRRTINPKVTFDSTPLISVRRTAWKQALREMEWFLSGSNNINDLHESVRHWWKDFTNKGIPNTVMYGYSHQLRCKTYFSNEVILVDVKRKIKPEVIIDESKFYQGIANGKVSNKSDFSYYKKGRSLWKNMIRRCYNKKAENYEYYGGKGYFVDKSWLSLQNFLEDLPKLPNFDLWLNSEEQMDLDKDYYQSNYYSLETCQFLPRKWNIEIRDTTPILIVDKYTSKITTYLNEKDALNNIDLDYFEMESLLLEQSDHNRYSISYTLPPKGKVYRKKLIFDQIEYLIGQLKKDPYSRRNVISCWDTREMESSLCPITNCHNTVTQVYVNPETNTVDLTTYQRSCDFMLGVPHNWIQMWAFLMYLAHQSGRKVGQFTWIGGDTHIYESHAEVADKCRYIDLSQIETPNLTYTPTSDNFKADDFTLDRPYKPILNEKLELIV